MSKGRIRIRKTYSSEPMSLDELQRAERLLARMIAKAHLAELGYVVGPDGLLQATSASSPAEETADGPAGSAVRENCRSGRE